MSLSLKDSLPIVSDLNSNTYGVDDGKVIIELTWTVPFNSKTSVDKCSTYTKDNEYEKIEF